MDGQPEGRECGMQSSQSIGAKLDEVLVKVRELSFNAAKEVEKRISNVYTRSHFSFELGCRYENQFKQ